MKKPEILSPAGSPERLKVAAAYGADAVYIGGEAFSLRAKAANFTPEEMEEGIAYAHSHGMKVYVTANIFARDCDLPELAAYMPRLEKCAPDGVLVSDLGALALAKKYAPSVPVHVSTQANTTNSAAAEVWHGLGAVRAVAARELSLSDLAAMKAAMPEGMELEAFVHGAMCMAYSGRCLLSAYFTGRGANRGECAQPCRYKYAVAEEKRPGVYLPVEEDGGGTHIFNAMDLCMLEHVPELIAAGIDSFKIEGRMKNDFYVASVTRCYRRAVDAFVDEGEEAYRRILPELLREISSCSVRPLSTGFYFGRPGEESVSYDSKASDPTLFAALVLENESGGVKAVQKNKFSVGDELVLMDRRGADLSLKVAWIKDEEGNAMPSAPHGAQVLRVGFDKEVQAEPFTVLRKPLL